MEIWDLEGKHTGARIWILGAGPGVMKACPGHPRIGLNRTWLAWHLDYFITGHYEMIPECPPRITRIYLQGGSGPIGDVPDLLQPVREQFAIDKGLPLFFDRERPVLVTKQNGAFAATHLALIMGASEIVYAGVEMNDDWHFYGHKESAMSFADFPHEQTFKDYFKILRDHEVRVLTTDPDSIVRRAGAEVFVDD